MLIFANGIIYVDKQNKKLLSLYSGEKKSLQFIRINSNILPIECTEKIKREWRSKINISPEDIVISFFGAIGEPKGFKYLLDAVQIVQKKLDKKIILLAIGGFHSYGENDRYQNEVKSLISKKHMKSWIKIIQKPDPSTCSKYLHLSDLAVSPFLKGVSENSGSTLASLIHEIPTIVTKGPLHSQKFFDSLGVSLCLPKDAHDLAKTIEQVINSEDIRDNMKKRLIHFKKIISWHRIAKETSKFFNTILSQ
jgi:glycosyltransferase involved in cell wall biosynthesis